MRRSGFKRRAFWFVSFPSMLVRLFAHVFSLILPTFSSFFPLPLSSCDHLLTVLTFFHFSAHFFCSTFSLFSHFSPRFSHFSHFSFFSDVSELFLRRCSPTQSLTAGGMSAVLITFLGLLTRNLEFTPDVLACLTKS